MKNTPRIFKHLCFIFTQGQNMCPWAGGHFRHFFWEVQIKGLIALGLLFSCTTYWSI
jgi:hypothetical protein